ncbi:MAG: head GIN domain-containing protein [Fimbriimonadaceae bacterium]
MRKLNLLLPFAAIAIPGCGIIGGVQGSGVAKSETRNVPSFSQVELRGASDVEVRPGKSISVKVTADDNLIPLIETRVEGGTLIIDTKQNVSTKIGIQVAIEVPSLTGVALQGSGDIRANGVEARDFAASISGSGNIEVSGKGSAVRASVAGSGDIDLSNLSCSEADASISGSGNISLGVISALRASIGGSGDISYSGDPKVEKSVSGSGEVRKRD